MYQYASVLLLTMAFYLNLSAQTITGHLNQFNNQSIRLEGFNGLKNYPISNTTIDTSGNFELNYSAADYGVGYLIFADENPFFVILSGEDIDIRDEALSYSKNLRIPKGEENQWFKQYAQEHLKENKL